jgi:hypothetical protein
MFINMTNEVLPVKAKHRLILIGKENPADVDDDDMSVLLNSICKDKRQQ